LIGEEEQASAGLPAFRGLNGRRARHENSPSKQRQPAATGQPAKSGQTGTFQLLRLSYEEGKGCATAPIVSRTAIPKYFISM
jgi:hypothetical protein